ncbi:dephospho kinase [Fusarium pseudocircinatum]|uniref:Dephospho kinase n=1 Tax=Fusarium pseudocircinatum TaxID=56676 RepID=A0A8H5UP20_9HYPO|nr:dephospho kinase [Fusarium pseudocircinatum]
MDAAKPSLKASASESSQSELLTSFAPTSWSGPIILGALLGYVVLCSLLRFSRINSLRSKLRFHDRASLSRMTNQDAFQIVQNIARFEFPLFYDLAVRLALFETYAVQTVAHVLYGGSDLANRKKAPKRYADTEAVYVCFANFPPMSPVLHKAVARTNFLHAPYIKSGKIKQEDLLYVLYASFAEPVRFLNIYEYRKLTDMEVASLSTLWKYVADMMDIDYRTVLGKNEWTDGLEFFEDMTRFGGDYEDKHLRPTPEIQKLGHVLMEMLLDSYPKIASPLGYPAACVLMGPRLRRAFGFPEPGLAMTVLTYSLLLVRKLIVRYLCLPRLAPSIYLSDPDEQTGRIKSYHYMKEPFYVPPTFWQRWNPEAIITWLSGGLLPGDGGPSMKSEGFLFEDLGPDKVVGKGVEETKGFEESVKTKAFAGCPYKSSEN